MANVNPDFDDLGDGADTITWQALANGDTVIAADLGRRKGIQSGAIQFIGTNWNGGTVTMQVSNDGTNWVTLKDIYGASVVFTADGLAEFTTGALWIRPSPVTVVDVDVVVSLK